MFIKKRSKYSVVQADNDTVTDIESLTGQSGHTFNAHVTWDQLGHRRSGSPAGCRPHPPSCWQVGLWCWLPTAAETTRESTLSHTAYSVERRPSEKTTAGVHPHKVTCTAAKSQKLKNNSRSTSSHSDIHCGKESKKKKKKKVDHHYYTKQKRVSLLVLEPEKLKYVQCLSKSSLQKSMNTQSHSVEEDWSEWTTVGAVHHHTVTCTVEKESRSLEN